MFSLYDSILKGGHVVDPANNVDGIFDVAINKGKIESVSDSLAGQGGTELFDVSGKIIMPGHIDTHAHLSTPGGDVDRSYGHRMLAESGTTTALDLAGNPSILCEGIKLRGAGLNVACIAGLQPTVTIPSEKPSRNVIRDLIYKLKDNGGIGVKMLGGYYPFSAETSSEIIQEANDQESWVAFHVGTKDSGSDITGLREVPEIIGRGRLHVAHVNSYTRGLTDTAEKEAEEAVKIISGIKNQVVSEVYLAQINGTNGLCDEDGNLVYNVARNCMMARKYSPDDNGLRKALFDGYGSAIIERGGRMILVSGPEAVEIWESNSTNQALSFPVNSPIANYKLVTAKYPLGDFVIDAISTDGGALPRNVAIERTMALVTFGALSISEAVKKLSCNPAEMLGLKNRGHFSQGAEADITVVDPSIGKACMSFVKGNVIMKDGKSVSQGGNWLILAEGEKIAKNSGIPYEIIDLSLSKLYR